MLEVKDYTNRWIIKTDNHVNLVELEKLLSLILWDDFIIDQVKAHWGEILWVVVKHMQIEKWTFKVVETTVWSLLDLFSNSILNLPIWLLGVRR